ncbi:MAG: hypothetical protein CMC36_05855 [Flavobacteriaceae bacterium]|nr:hypothetical protein [Flavobacteriaceae bacterium]MAU31408.1 hypothetical protein [Flavobacteriaceae bacterium]|tara:strand:- start:142 stop:822 length:681 start_codon:yes stop_codon:yes gene_type:complete
MLKYFISIITFLFINITLGNVKIADDTIEKFGVRAGLDLNKIIRSATDEDYAGFSLSGDIRLMESFYIFSEIGNEVKEINSNYINSSVKGTYVKFGVNFKLNNDIRTQNIVYSGLSVGYSNFDQNINSYTIYNTHSNYWGQSTINNPINLSNLNTLWIEFIFGMKTEILNNLFLGFELQLKNIIKQKNIQNITNFYIPGFNRTYDSSGLGAGFSYTVSYLIPVIKK